MEHLHQLTYLYQLLVKELYLALEELGHFAVAICWGPLQLAIGRVVAFLLLSDLPILDSFLIIKILIVIFQLLLMLSLLIFVVNTGI